MRLAHSPHPITKRSRAGGPLALLLAMAFAAALTGCESSSEVTSGPSPVKCQVSLAMSSTPIESGGGTGNVAVTTQPECTWDAAAEANWISEVSPTSGQGAAEVKFRVAANPLPSTRQADIVINGGHVRIIQAASPCRFEIAPRSQVLAATGGSGSVTVTALSGCSWTATSQASWLSLTQPLSGSGSGTLAFTVAPNSGAERSAAVSVADQTFAVTQARAGTAPGPAPSPTCVYTLSPTNQSVPALGGVGISVGVSAGGGCSWAATSNASWLTVGSGANGTGNGTVTFTVAANSGSARTGTLTIAGKAFTVSQAAGMTCSYGISPTSQTITALGGVGQQISVSTSGGCPWTASRNDSWITITSGATGTGSGQVGFNVAANLGGQRIGTLTIAGQTFTVTQQAVLPCVYVVKPTSKDVGKGGSNGVDIDVTTTPNCAWTATSNAAWITVTSGASGTGSGKVRFAVANNNGADRDGTLTVAGQTVTVHQKD